LDFYSSEDEFFETLEQHLEKETTPLKFKRIINKYLLDYTLQNLSPSISIENAEKLSKLVPERLFAICKYMIIEGTNRIPLKIEAVLNDIEVYDFLSGDPVDVKAESAFRKYDIKTLKDLKVIRQITDFGDEAEQRNYYLIEYNILDRLYTFYRELIKICDNLHYVPSNILTPEDEPQLNLPILTPPVLPYQPYFNLQDHVESHKFSSNSFMDKYDWILEDWDRIELKLRRRNLKIPQLIEILEFDKQIDAHHTNLMNLLRDKNFLRPIINKSTNQAIIQLLSFFEQNYPNSKQEILDEKLITDKITFGSRDFGQILKQYPEYLASKEFEQKLSELKFGDIWEFLSNFSNEFLCKSTKEFSDKFWQLLQTIIKRNINLRNLRRLYFRFHKEFPQLFENLLEQLDLHDLIQSETDAGWIILFYWEVLFKNKPLFSKYFDLPTLLEKFDELCVENLSKTLTNGDLFQVERDFQDIRNMIQFLESVDKTLLNKFLTPKRVFQFLELCRNHFKLKLYLLKIIKHNGIELSNLNISTFLKTEINQFKKELDYWTIQEIVRVFGDELPNEFISGLFHIHLYETPRLPEEEITLSCFNFKLKQIRSSFPNYDISNFIEFTKLREWIKTEDNLFEIFELLRQIKEINSDLIEQLLPEALLQIKVAKSFEILSKIEESSSPFDPNVYDRWGWLELFNELFPNEIENYEIFSELNRVFHKRFSLYVFYEILKLFKKSFTRIPIILPNLRMLKENLVYHLKRYHLSYLEDYLELILSILQNENSPNYDEWQKFSDYLVKFKIL